MRGYLRLDLADNCNIRCVMCQAYNDLPISRMKFVDFDNFVARTRGQLDEWTVIQLGNVAEPTVHPRFSEFLRYFRSESDATIHVVTNGKLLHHHAEVINDVGSCLVQVSMDTVHKQTHEYVCCGSKYDRLVANLGMLYTKRTRVLLSFTLMNSNIDEYDDMIKFCRKRGFQMSAFPMILRAEHGVLPLKLVRESLWFNREGLRSWMERHYGKDYGGVVFGAAPGTSNGATPIANSQACWSGHDRRGSSRHVVVPAAADPLLPETQQSYNIVGYRSKFWALPLALGHIDLAEESLNPRKEVIVAETLEELRALRRNP